MILAGIHATRPLQPVRSMRDFGRRATGFCLRWVLRRVDAQLCPPGRLPTRGIHRVLVVRPNHRLGNAVLVSPLLDEIEAIYPGAEIDMISAGCAARTLFSTRFHMRRVLALPRRIARHPFATMACLRQVRASSYDLAIDPCMTSHSGHLLLGMCRARYKVGFDSDTTFELLRKRDPGLPEHLAKRGVHALRRTLTGTTRTSWPSLDVRLAPIELQRGRHALDRILGDGADPCGRERPVIGVFANATGNKRLPEAWWGALVTHLKATRPDVRIVDVLAEHGSSQLPAATASFYTRDLRKLAAVLADMQAFVSGDCGVMHLAAAVGTPTLGLFLHANRAKYVPYGGCNGGLDVMVNDARGDSCGASMAHMSIMAWLRKVVAPDAGTEADAVMHLDAPSGAASTIRVSPAARSR